MLKKFSILFAAGLVVTLPSAFAATNLQISLQETGYSDTTSSSPSGAVSINNMNYGDFQINTVSGIGSPVFGAPTLDLQTLNITSTSLAASHTLTIMLTQTGVTGLSNPFSFLSNFSGILTGVTSEQITSYVDPSNTAFGTADQLSTVHFTAAGSNAFNQVAQGPTANPFSETEIIVATFAPTTTGDGLNSSAVISSAVPEPASLALLGGGLLGLAFIRRRSAKKSN